MIGKLIVGDINEADLSGFIGLEFVLYNTVSMESFAFHVVDEPIVLPCYHIILSIAAFPLVPLFPQELGDQHDRFVKLGDQHDRLAENVPEELTHFIWRNFGSVPFDDLLIGGTAMVSGMMPDAELTIGDSNHLSDHHPNVSPFWNYKICGHGVFYSKGALARWVRNVLRWHRFEFRRVQSLPNFSRQTLENYMASVPQDIAR